MAGAPIFFPIPPILKVQPCSCFCAGSSAYEPQAASDCGPGARLLESRCQVGRRHGAGGAGRGGAGQDAKRHSTCTPHHRNHCPPAVRWHGLAPPSKTPWPRGMRSLQLWASWAPSRQVRRGAGRRGAKGQASCGCCVLQPCPACAQPCQKLQREHACQAQLMIRHLHRRSAACLPTPPCS